MLALLMLLQGVAGPPGDDPVTPAPPKADCARVNADQITVCARSPDADRLKPLPSKAPATLPKAAVTKRLSASTTVSAKVESREFDDHGSVAAMVHLDTAF